jgi:surface antigen
MCMGEDVSRRAWPALGFVLAAALSGCGGSGATRAPRVSGVGGYQGSAGMSCVPYARARTGIELRGDAWEWWDAAAGRYQRGRRPAPGTVLVFGRTRRLPQGHVSVVRRVVAAREIRVDHANWAEAGGQGRGRVSEDQPVLDVSPGNDWSALRVWFPPIQDYGNTVFAAHGFIAPQLLVTQR